MRRIWLCFLTVVVLAMSVASAEAKRRGAAPMAEPPVVVARINVTNQSLWLTVHGWPVGIWPVSTAGQGYHTPRGVFRVQRMAKVWFSRKYDNSPMPNSLFFDGGIAIHGSYHVNSLGRPVSHGCVRLAPENAARLYAMAEEYGPRRIQIIVTD